MTQLGHLTLSVRWNPVFPDFLVTDENGQVYEVGINGMQPGRPLACECRVVNCPHVAAVCQFLGELRQKTNLVVLSHYYGKHRAFWVFDIDKREVESIYVGADKTSCSCSNVTNPSTPCEHIQAVEREVTQECLI